MADDVAFCCTTAPDSALRCLILPSSSSTDSSLTCSCKRVLAVSLLWFRITSRHSSSCGLGQSRLCSEFLWLHRWLHATLCIFPLLFSSLVRRQFGSANLLATIPCAFMARRAFRPHGLSALLLQVLWACDAGYIWSSLTPFFFLALAPCKSSTHLGLAQHQSIREQQHVAVLKNV